MLVAHNPSCVLRHTLFIGRLQASNTYNGNVDLKSLAAVSNMATLESCVIGTATFTPPLPDTAVLNSLGRNIACTFTTQITRANLISGNVEVQANISGAWRPINPTLAAVPTWTARTVNIAIVVTSPVVTISEQITVDGVVRSTYVPGERGGRPSCRTINGLPCCCCRGRGCQQMVNVAHTDEWFLYALSFADHDAVQVTRMLLVGFACRTVVNYARVLQSRIASGFGSNTAGRCTRVHHVVRQCLAQCSVIIAVVANLA
jgi:hypothetical protein